MKNLLDRSRPQVVVLEGGWVSGNLKVKNSRVEQVVIGTTDLVITSDINRMSPVTYL